jgi:hypothetical protein
MGELTRVLANPQGRDQQDIADGNSGGVRHPVCLLMETVVKPGLHLMKKWRKQCAL